MDIRFENREKFEILGVDIPQMCAEIQNEMMLTELYTMGEKEILLLEKIIGDSIEVEFDIKEPEENIRLSFYAINNKVVVIRKKQINMKLFFEMLMAGFEFVEGNDVSKIVILIKALLEVFFHILDDDLSQVYSHLCCEYFVKGKKYALEEMCDEMNKYLICDLGVQWSENRINKILFELENLRVIEFIDGFLNVKDKIYFGNY